MKMYKKIIAGICSLMLVFNMALLPAFADSEAKSNGKEEVVYVISDADGKVNGTYVVNIFTDKEVVDYGDYKSVKMLTTNDEITDKDGKITYQTDSDKTYYQGVLENAQIPWNISIKYFLDGKEYSADEVAGKSGKLEIKYKITQNKECKTDFYDNYALQTTFTLNTENCKNIVAADATMANVGEKKQLNYTTLAGKGIETSITADVTDFEMDDVAINAIKLKMNIDINDKEVRDKVNELMDAMTQLDDGATSLNSGASELKDGSSKLDTGAGKFSSGVKSLDDGVTALQSGINEVNKGLTTLNSNSSTLTSSSKQIKSALNEIDTSLSDLSVSTDDIVKLSKASTEIKSGIDSLYAGIQKLQQSQSYDAYKSTLKQNGLDVDLLKSSNEQTIKQLTSQIADLKKTLSQIENVPGYEEQVAQLKSQIDSLGNIITLLTANNASIDGTKTYLDSLSSATKQLESGMKDLQSNYAEFDTAIQGLVTKLNNMLPSLTKLSDGISELSSKYKEFDKGLNEYTSGVSSLSSGYAKIMTGVSSLAAGSKELLKNSNDLYSGASDLYDGVSELCDGTVELKDGTDELNSKTTSMESKVETQVEDLLKTITGDDSETFSFVSDKNENVESVQFVIKVDGVKKAEVKDDSTKEEKKLTFWEKFKNLFTSDK